jgi:hypothetical protein
MSHGLPPRDREQLLEGLGLGKMMGGNSKAPLLAEILRLSKVSVLKSETPTDDRSNSRTEDESSMPSSLEILPKLPSAGTKLDLSSSSAGLQNSFSSLNASAGAQNNSRGVLDGTFTL